MSVDGKPPPSLALLSLDPPLASLTLNRPERHNSLVPEMLEQILKAIESVRRRPEVRALVMLANGPSFSTGGDLKRFVDRLNSTSDAVGDDASLIEYSYTLVGQLNRLILAMLDLPIPIVTAVQGIVTGGSLGLVLASDVVLVSAEASFTPYYSVVGFSPDGGWTAMLPDVIGLRRTSEILLTNQTITAEQAVSWGLASRLVPVDVLPYETIRTARSIAQQQAVSLRQMKALQRSRMGDIEFRLEMERERFVQTIHNADTKKKMVSFLKSLSQKPRDAKG